MVIELDSMSDQSQCPKCNSKHIYPDGNLWICPECSYEWSAFAVVNEAGRQDSKDQGVRDAHGNVLSSGDSVILVKELKIKGSSSAIKAGTKVKNIRLIEADDGHNIACKIDGAGAINLKSEFVKKA